MNNAEKSIEQEKKDNSIQQAKPVPQKQVSVQEEFDKGVEVEKFYHQINGDIFEITRRVRARDDDTIEQKVIKRRESFKHPNHQSLEIPTCDLRTTSAVSQSPKPPPRLSSKQKSAEAEYNNFQIDHEEFRGTTDWFDRKARQRHSARSAESGPVRDETLEWLDKKKIPLRASSGPSEIPFLKDDISEWLLENLPQKRTSINNKHSTESVPQEVLSSYSKNLKDELTELLKKPLQRQHSGPSGEISVLKSDIIEWLTKLQATKNKIGKGGGEGAIPKHKRKGSGDTTKQVHYPSDHPELIKPRKRHSFGNTEKDKDQSSCSEWIPYPLSRLQSVGKALEKKISLQDSTGYPLQDFHRKPKDGQEKIIKPDRKLRHSASEVVSSNLERLYAQPRKDTQYQYVPKETFSFSNEFNNVMEAKLSKREHTERSERSRRHQTQRSATVSDITEGRNHRLQSTRKSSSAERAPRSPSPQCTDPTCPLLPICTDPHCCYIATECCGSSCHDVNCPSMCPECRCKSLPRCTNPKCVNVIKCNSLPRSAAELHRNHVAVTPQYYYRSNSQPNTLTRGDSRSSLLRIPKTKSINGTNGKLTKSASAASLNSRRRRHKTVHFGENLLREVCQNRKLLKPVETPSGSAPLQPNIQMLYNFVEGVLSAWVDDEDDHKSGAESESDGMALKPIHLCNRIRLQTIRRIVTEAAELRGTLKLGNSRYRHRHWRGTAKDCNERFLKKVKDENFILTGDVNRDL